MLYTLFIAETLIYIYQLDPWEFFIIILINIKTVDEIINNVVGEWGPYLHIGYCAEVPQFGPLWKLRWTWECPPVILGPSLRGQNIGMFHQEKDATKNTGSIYESKQTWIVRMLLLSEYHSRTTARKCMIDWIK